MKIKLIQTEKYGTYLADNKGNIIIKNLNVEQILDFKNYQKINN